MACEKCWADAFKRTITESYKTQAEHYRGLLRERSENWCTLEEQRGEAIDQADDQADGYKD